VDVWVWGGKEVVREVEEMVDGEGWNLGWKGVAGLVVDRGGGNGKDNATSENVRVRPAPDHPKR
jgi:hypothetical protein